MIDLVKPFKVGDPVTIHGATKEDTTVAAGDYFVQAFDTPASGQPPEAPIAVFLRYSLCPSNAINLR